MSLLLILTQLVKRRSGECWIIDLVEIYNGAGIATNFRNTGHRAKDHVEGRTGEDMIARRSQ